MGLGSFNLLITITICKWVHPNFNSTEPIKFGEEFSFVWSNDGWGKGSNSNLPWSYFLFLIYFLNFSSTKLRISIQNLNVYGEFIHVFPIGYQMGIDDQTWRLKFQTYLTL